MNFKRVLVLAPHTDDAELGCGGTIIKMVDEGAEVIVVAFSTAEDSLPEGVPKDTLKVEFLNAMPFLGVKNENVLVYNYPVRKLSYHRQEVLEEIIKLKNKYLPDMVFIPSGNDLHQDHQVLHNEGLRAFKDSSVLGYELPWNHIHFSAQAFFSLTEKQLNSKWRALQEYKTQIELERPYFTKEFIFGLAKVRGIQIKTNYAEAFEVLRIKL